jgi:hypothetical protein
LNLETSIDCFWVQFLGFFLWKFLQKSQYPNSGRLPKLTLFTFFSGRKRPLFPKRKLNYLNPFGKLQNLAITYVPWKWMIGNRKMGLIVIRDSMVIKLIECAILISLGLPQNLFVVTRIYFQVDLENSNGLLVTKYVHKYKIILFVHYNIIIMYHTVDFKTSYDCISYGLLTSNTCVIIFAWSIVM